MWEFIREALITLCAPNTARFIYIFMVKKFHKCEINVIFVAYQRVSASKCVIEGCQEAFGDILSITSHSIGHANREPSTACFNPVTWQCRILDPIGGGQQLEAALCGVRL